MGSISRCQNRSAQNRGGAPMTTSASAASRGNAHECMRTMWVRCLAPTASPTICQDKHGIGRRRADAHRAENRRRPVCGRRLGHGLAGDFGKTAGSRNSQVSRALRDHAPFPYGTGPYAIGIGRTCSRANRWRSACSVALPIKAGVRCQVFLRKSQPGDFSLL